MEINETISFNDLAKLLNISKNKLTRLTKQGLPCVSLGTENKIFFRDSVAKWLKSQEKTVDNMAQP